MAHEIFERYEAAMAYIAVENAKGDQGIGTAFHVGEGVFVTAWHVVENSTILEVATTNDAYIPLTGEEAARALVTVHRGDNVQPSYWVQAAQLRISRGPFLHSDSQVDIAVFTVEGLDDRAPFVPLGSHLDDWIGRSEFVLTEAVVLGYPPVPLTTEPILIGARAEVNAQVDLRHSPHVHFILSTMPRGGFSGGVAISEYGFALGVITSSLLNDRLPAELGYMNTITVEPVFSCLAENRILPDCQADGWDGFWNTARIEFTGPSRTTFNGVWHSEHVTSSVEAFDDGKRAWLGFRVVDGPRIEDVLATALAALSGEAVDIGGLGPGGFRLTITRYGPATSSAVLACARAVSTMILSVGSVASPYGDKRLLPGIVT